MWKFSQFTFRFWWSWNMYILYIYVCVYELLLSKCFFLHRRRRFCTMHIKWLTFSLTTHWLSCSSACKDDLRCLKGIKCLKYFNLQEVLVFLMSDYDVTVQTKLELLRKKNICIDWWCSLNKYLLLCVFFLRGDFVSLFAQDNPTET